MKREQQDLAWASLPKETRTHIRKRYRESINMGLRNFLCNFFGHHNLTSDTEPEEVLTILRKDIIEEFNQATADLSRTGNLKYEGKRELLKNLFGDKCLPDTPDSSNFSNIGKDEPEVVVAKNATTTEPKEDSFAKSELEHRLEQTVQESVQVEPKPEFKVGDKVTIKATAIDKCFHIGEIIGFNYTYNPDMYEVKVTPCGAYVLHQTDLEPYTEENKETMEAKEKQKDAKDEAKELNLCELLKGCEGECFYSPICRVVILKAITENDIKPLYWDFGMMNVYTYADGRIYSDSVQAIYPSRALYEKYPLDARKAWQIWASERKSKRWRAEYGEMYYSLRNDFTVCDQWENSDSDNDEAWDNYNYFRTKELAEQAAEAVRETLEKFHEQNQKQ